MTKLRKKDFKVEYDALVNARHRCSNPKNAHYKDYGGRGLQVHESFLGPDGFWNFLASVGRKPSAELTLDRVDNTKGYEPGNLAWTSRKVQQRNRRPTKPRIIDLGWGSKTHTVFCYDGKKTRTFDSPLVPLNDQALSLYEWSKLLNINARTLRQRLQRGLTPAQALVPTLFDTWGKPRDGGPTIH